MVSPVRMLHITLRLCRITSCKRHSVLSCVCPRGRDGMAFPRLPGLFSLQQGWQLWGTGKKSRMEREGRGRCRGPRGGRGGVAKNSGCCHIHICMSSPTQQPVAQKLPGGNLIPNRLPSLRTTVHSEPTVPDACSTSFPLPPLLSHSPIPPSLPPSSEVVRGQV